MTSHIDFEKTAQLLKGILKRDTRSISKALTLIESALPKDKKQSEILLEQLLLQKHKSLRIAISGIPGVGKSSFIDEFGRILLEENLSIAVLAVDPSSPISGGSILGDRTRMQYLSSNDKVFIRPSPGGTNQGGVARRTRESLLLLEGAGFDIVLVETIGVGQSEYKVSDMVDIFLLLAMPATGDDLQAMKRGINEVADIIAITKSDGLLLPAAKLTQAELESSFKLNSKALETQKSVVLTSALEKTGFKQIWQSIRALQDYREKNGEASNKRKQQYGKWLDAELEEQTLDIIKKFVLQNPEYAEVKKQVELKKTLPRIAAEHCIKNLLKSPSKID
ncbi:MAG: methylmalonyl Co-A mutase-associated GTPase MeaB [Oligoflexales bacterium]|nr:methylmalonyl Co-A mutase-associated GTPase MeaB [Oligoflexales bacterium]